LLLFVAINGQEASTKNSLAEDTIRAAYAKLEIYNRAAELEAMEGIASKVRDDSVLKFTLTNFHTGALEEIKNLRVSEIITLRDGDIVQISTGSYSHDSGPAEAFYEARWTKQSKENVPDWVLADLLQLLIDEYFDVGHFTSYEVIVSFEGKNRRYKAVAFHHDQGESAVEPKLTFWDSIGADGRLGQVLTEQRRPYGTKQNRSTKTSKN
jgi:hypothetical protein